MIGFPSVLSSTAPACRSRGRRGIVRLRGALPSGRIRSLCSRSLPAPDEHARGPKLEAAESAHLDLERALHAANAVGLRLLLLLVHHSEDSLVIVRKHVLALLAVLVAALLASAAATASSPPPVQAREVLVADGRTGEILYERDADRRMAMASITKLMTAIVTLENARPGDMVTVLPQAVAAGESSIFLTAGEKLRVRELLAAALDPERQRLGLRACGARRRRKRPALRGDDEREGRGAGARGHALRAARRPGHARPLLDRPRHGSSSRVSPCASPSSAASCACALPRSRRTAQLETWNDLLWTFPGLIGVKTGHTDKAGWSEVAAARRGPTTVYAVILGSPSRERRNADLTKLLEWGFDQYVSYEVVRKGERYATAAVPFAEDERLDLVAAAGASELVRLGDGSQFVERVLAPEMVDLPVHKGQKLGEVVVMEGDREVARTDLVADTGHPGAERGRARCAGTPTTPWTRPATSSLRSSPGSRPVRRRLGSSRVPSPYPVG